MSDRPGRRTAGPPGSVSAVDLRRAMIGRHRSMAIQIRKQRKEETLRRKRQMPAATSGSAPFEAVPASSSSAVSWNPTSPHPTIILNSKEDMTSLLDTIIQDKGHQSFQALMTFQKAMETQKKHLDPFLQNLVATDASKSLALISTLKQHLTSSSAATLAAVTDLGVEAAQVVVLSILLDLSALVAKVQAADAYYGHAPLRWSDLIADEPQLVSLLISFIEAPTNNPSSHLNTSTNHSSRMMSTHILGHLVQDSPRALAEIWPRWGSLVQALPASSFLCAAVIKSDMTHLGTDLMMTKNTATSEQSSGTRTDPLLLLECMADLLKPSSSFHTPTLTPGQDDSDNHDHSAAVIDAAWMVEGLSRREDAAVDILCSQSVLMTNLMRRIYQYTTSLLTGGPPGDHNHSSSRAFLVPAFKAVEHLATAAQGRHVGYLLSFDLLRDALSLHLSRGILVDAAAVASCFLYDAGLPHHPSTTVAAPILLPLLVQILVSSPIYAWKLDAALAIDSALTCPPLVLDAPQAEIDLTAPDAILRGWVTEYIWPPSWSDAPRESLLRSLVDLIKGTDWHGVQASLHIADRLLRLVPESRSYWESVSGVDSLEQICQRQESGTWYTTSSSLVESEGLAEMAARLLDDFFSSARADEEEDEYYQPDLETNRPSLMWGSSLSAVASSGPVGSGRGRGRTLPAWMRSSSPPS